MAKPKAKTASKAAQVVSKGVIGKTIIQHIADSVDPFSKVSGKKIHDENSVNTFTTRLRSRTAMRTNTNGMGYLEVYPTIKTIQRGVDSGTPAFLTSGGSISGAATFTEVDANQYSTINTNAHKYRVVSYGIKVKCLDNALNAKGMLHIRTLDKQNALNNVDVLQPSDDLVVVPISKDMDYIIVPAHTTGYGEFLEPSENYATIDADNAQTNAFRCIGLTILGAPGTEQDYLELDIVHNIECMPIVGQLGQLISTKAAPEHPHLKAAISNTRTNLPPVHKTGSFRDKLVSFAKQAATYAGEALLGRAGSALMKFLAPSSVPAIEVD